MKDIYNISNNVTVDGNTYELEFDNRAYAIVENQLNKGTFKIFQSFVIDNNLKMDECLQIFCAGLIKHHSAAEIEKIKRRIEKNPAILHKNLYSLQFSFANPLILPEVAQEVIEQNGDLKKNLNPTES